MRSLRVITLAMFAACASAANAEACFMLSPVRSLFFNETPVGIDAAVIARVTLMAVGKSNISDEPIQYAVARVDRIIKGEIERPFIWIGIRRLTCGDWLGPGSNGIVVGSLLRHAQGSIELMPVLP